MVGDLALAEYSDHRRLIMPIIESVSERDQLPGLTEEIDKAFADAEAFLFVAPTGFIVLKPSIINHIPSVLILFAYCKARRATSRYLPFVEKLAHEVGASQLAAYTKVKGHMVVYRSHGFVMKGKSKSGSNLFIKELSL